MITLYINPHCGYCKKTLATAQELGIPVTVKDKNVPGVADEVLKLGGKKQYPFISDSLAHITMYESRDIMAYFKDHAPGQ